MKTVITALWLTLLLSVFSTHSSELQYQHVETPDWVEVRDLNTEVAVPTDLISSGTFYRIVDDQIRITPEGEKHYFTRMAQTVANSKGLDGSSQIQIYFDPNYQTLLVHDISVVRDGQRFERYHSAEISLFKSEDEADRQIYSGTLTFNAILDDVRVGDTVDYSYTIVGSNPIYKGLFSAARSLVWSIPVQDQYHRVLWGKSVPLYVTQRNGMAPLTEQQRGEYTDYSVQVQMAQPQRYSSQAPDWSLPQHRIFYTETSSWQQVNDWAMELYTNLGIDEDVRAIADTIRNQTSKPEQQLALALTYVQENIRYVGIQIGDNSHLPTPASETLRLKYGDCKDKSVLMLALMRELGLTGYPALVNTDIGQSLNDIVPAISRFDHVIVQASIGDKQYWLDPTLSNQIGPLDNLYQPDFGYALVVRQGQATLTKMNAQRRSQVRIEETFTIPAEVTQPSQFNVQTSYLGLPAQRILARVQNTGAARLQEQYLEYYQRTYPDTTVSAPLDIAVDEASGWVTLTEHYDINNVFTEDDDGYNMYFYATDIRSELVKPDDIKRNAPFARNYPATIEQRIRLEFQEDGWDFDDEAFTEDNPYFSYQQTAEFENNTLTLSYYYQAKQDHVPADEINLYLAARERAMDNSSYSIIKYRPTTQTQTSESTSHDFGVQLDEGMVVLWYIGLAIVLFGLLLIDWRFAAISRQDSENLWFQPMAFAKFYLLGLFTFGAYCNYWMYRNWLLVDKQEHKGIWPIARGIFAVFWLYPLYRKLAEHSSTLSEPPRLFAKPVAILLAVAYIILSFSNAFTESTALGLAALAILPALFLPFIQYINRLYPSDSKDYKLGSKIGFRHVFASLIFLPLVLWSVAQMAHLVPSSVVVKGEQLWQHDISFMQQQGLIAESQQIEYFYSDALVSIRQDGNGFTSENVFSYWVDDESGFASASARYDEIKDIEVEYAESELDNTIVKVIRHDDSTFLLYVSSIEKKDRPFVEALLSNWNKSKQSEEVL